MDRELLVLAAKAAGLGIDEIVDRAEGYAWVFDPDSIRNRDGEAPIFKWNPLVDDGDALRLAGALGLVVDTSRPSAGEPFKLHHFAQDNSSDRGAAIRRAIVRAAAEIGRAHG